MADAVAVDTWSADAVRLSDVVDALADLRDRSAARSSARTAVMSLVAVAAGDEQAYAATNTLRALGGHHPARIVVVRPYPDLVAALDARATLYALQLEDHRINFEEVTLSVAGQAAHHLDSLVEAFTLSDLPIAVWYVNSLPDALDPLLSLATAVIIDSRDASDDARLRSLRELSRRRTVVDLSWIRLAAWRELLSGLFDPPDLRPFLAGIRDISLSGKPGARRLFGGWLCAQLKLTPDQITFNDARHVDVKIVSVVGGNRAVFTVERSPTERVVLARVEVDGEPWCQLRAELSDNPLPTSLASAMTHLDPDPVWERSLSAATSLGD